MDDSPGRVAVSGVSRLKPPPLPLAYTYTRLHTHARSHACTLLLFTFFLFYLRVFIRGVPAYFILKTSQPSEVFFNQSARLDSTRLRLYSGSARARLMRAGQFN